MHQNMSGGRAILGWLWHADTPWKAEWRKAKTRIKTNKVQKV
jgi:hypothetical protein